MNNDQILCWIAQNNEVYLKEVLEQANKEAETRMRKDPPTLFKTILSKYFKILKEFLEQGKTVSLGSEINFFTSKVKRVKEKTVSVKPQYFLAGKIKRFVACSPTYQQQQQIIKKAISFREACQTVASLLLFDTKLVQNIIDIFMRATCDLILSGKQVLLCLPFCNLKLSKTKSECSFSEKFIAKLNESKMQGQGRRQYLSRFRGKFQAQEMSEERRFYRACWQQIKEGNEFEYPSLREIQKHLDKGYYLELKYKSQFQ